MYIKPLNEKIYGKNLIIINRVNFDKLNIIN